MWRFDARIVTYRFPAQSVTASIELLVKQFCNPDAAVPHALDFVTTFVQAGMASIPSFDVVNERPSTVMRTLTATLGGGFYIDGLTRSRVGGLADGTRADESGTADGRSADAEIVQAHADATQLRRRVLVEGRRTSTLVGYPTCAPGAPPTARI